MKKKTFFKTTFVAVSIAACAWGSFSTTEEDAAHFFDKGELLLANVEALSQNTGEANSEKTCDTKATQYTSKGLVTCPTCRAQVGFLGTIYSCQPNGSFKICKNGKVGTDTSCTPTHGFTKNYKDAPTISCP